MFVFHHFYGLPGDENLTVPFTVQYLAIPAPGHSAKDPPRTPQPSLVRIQALLALAPLLSGSAGHPPNQASSNGADVKFGVAHRLWWIKAKILTLPDPAGATWS